jgi:hypothetical protein
MHPDKLRFQTLQFQGPTAVVYVFYFRRKDREVPFYVGETGRLLGRISDYHAANLTASTDFKVGVAARHLQERRFDVLIKYAETTDRKRAEKAIRKELSQDHKLLNDVRNSKFAHLSLPEATRVVREFVERELLGEEGG